MASSRRALVSIPRRVGVLFSGGLDSAALIGLLLQDGCEVWPVYVRSGLPWERFEIRSAKRFLSAIHHRNLRSLEVATLALENAYRDNWSHTGRTPGSGSDDRAVFLPARNLLLITKALLLLTEHKSSALCIATLKGNPFPDAKPSYFRKLESVLSDGFMRGIRIIAPLRRFNKADVIRDTAAFPLHLTVSCISPVGGRHCGRCNKCAERRRAFREAGVPDRTRYARLVKRRVRRSS